MRSGAIGPVCLGLALAAVSALAVRHAVIAIRFPYPQEYPEGITAHWARQAAAGACLYPAVDPVSPMHNPYPPLFYRIAAPLQDRSPNPFLASRLTALAGLLACGGAIAWLLRRSGPLHSVVGALLFVLSPVALRYGTTARVDLPALAMALASAASLSCGAGPWSRVAAGLLAGGAMLTKPVFFAAAAAGLLVSWRAGRRPLAYWTAGLAAALVAGFFWFGAPAGNVVRHLWTLNQLPWNAGGLVRLAGQTMARHPLLFAGFVLFIGRRPDTRDAFGWYAVCALPAVLTAGKTGADENYFLELLAVACVGAARLAADRAFLPILAAIQVMLYLPVQPALVFTRTYEQELAETSSRFTPSSRERDAGSLLVAELRQAGRALSQSPGLMLAAGRVPEWDAYQFTQRSRAKLWDDAPLANAVSNGAFDLVLMQSDPVAAANYFSPHVRSAVETHYTLHRAIGPWLLLRRQPSFSERDAR